MCLITFAFHQHPDFPLIVAANRDEYHKRPTASAHFWEDTPSIYAGRDLEAGGTWMGVNREGGFAALTNYREFNNTEIATSNLPIQSRGRVCSELLGLQPTRTILSRLEQQATRFAGFNVIAGNSKQLFYYSNKGTKIQQLSPGIYGLSNALIDSPWPKVISSKQALMDVLEGHPTSERLLNIMSDTRIAPDNKLPNTGIDIEMERLLSSRFIQSNEYGTRSSTAVLFHHDGSIEYTEQNFDNQGNKLERITQQLHTRP